MIDPFNPYFHNVAAVYYLRLGKMEKSKKHIMEAIVNLPDIGYHSFFRPYLGNKVFRKIVEKGLYGALKNTIRKGNIYYQLLNFYLMENKVDKATECLKHLKKYSSWKNAPLILLLEGRLALLQKDYQRAFALLDAYCSEKQWAKDSIDRALKVVSTRKESVEMIRFVDFIVEKWGKLHPYLNFVKADILFKNKQWKEAVRWFEKYLNENPDDGKAYLELGLTYLYMRDGLYAEENFRKAIDRGVSKPQVYLYLVKSLMLQGETDQAVFELEAASRYFPDNYDILQMLVSLYEKKRYYSKAAKLLEKICKKYKSNIYLNLTMCRDYYLSGDIQEAFECYRNLLKKYPDNNEIKKEFQKLRF